VALHHLEAPWKPAEVEQRDGRILRQGNDNKEVAIYRTFQMAIYRTFQTPRIRTVSIHGWPS
jgi:ABC-type branched-subunit amino acid transport system ATPase component